jgi:hypothetical protein
MVPYKSLCGLATFRIHKTAQRFIIVWHRHCSQRLSKGPITWVFYRHQYFCVLVGDDLDKLLIAGALPLGLVLCHPSHQLASFTRGRKYRVTQPKTHSQ